MMKFDYCEPLEFIAALTMAAKIESMNELAQELKFTPDPPFTEMLEDVISRISRHVKEELARFFGKTLTYDRLDAVLSQVFYDDDKVKTVEAWMECYNKRQPGELAAMLVEAVYASSGPDWRGGFSFEEVRQDSALLHRLVAAVPLPDGELHAELMDCAKFPGEFKRRTQILLDSFFCHGFLVLRERLRELGEEGAARYDVYFHEQPEKAFGEIANSGKELIVKNTRVHVSYISQVRVDFRHFEGVSRLDWMILGYRNDALASQREEKEAIEQFLKVISDKRRLEIIGLLKKSNRYAGELAQLLMLTPAAINYHTNLLIDLNLIRITRMDSRIYYVLDTERLAALMDQTKSLLLR